MSPKAKIIVLHVLSTILLTVLIAYYSNSILFISFNFLALVFGGVLANALGLDNPEGSFFGSFLLFLPGIILSILFIWWNYVAIKPWKRIVSAIGVILFGVYPLGMLLAKFYMFTKLSDELGDYLYRSGYVGFDKLDSFMLAGGFIAPALLVTTLLAWINCRKTLARPHF